MSENKTYKFRGENTSTTIDVPIDKKNGLQAPFAMSWPTAMSYIVAVVETHAKKSYFKDGANKVIKEQLMHCAEVAELARKKGGK